MQRVKRVRAGAGEHLRVLVPCLVAQPLESDRTVNLDPQLRLSEPLMRERQFLPPWHIHRATGSKLQQSAYASSRFSRLSPPRSRTMRKSLRSRVAIRRSPCTWATQSSEASARSIGKLPYCRIQPAINSRADPLSSAPFRPPSDTQERKRGAMSTGIRWQTSVRTGQVDTKAPLCLRKKAHRCHGPGHCGRTRRPIAGGAAFLGRTGKAADQSEAFRQSRRAGGVLLQQVKASLAQNTTAWPRISLRIRGCRDVSSVTSTLMSHPPSSRAGLPDPGGG